MKSFYRLLVWLCIVNASLVGCTKTGKSYDNSFRELTYATPLLSKDGETVTYGLYPQTYVNDSSLVSSLNELTTAESNGWYLYNEEYYAKTSATPLYSNYVFGDGTTIVNDAIYWFKCEPIVWEVLSNNDGNYFILSNVSLDAHCYYNSESNRIIDDKTIYPNNYEYSDIRAWLNEDFFNSAFFFGDKHIQVTTVDNSAYTTDSSTNIYACDNTNDKVFLPSYQDYEEFYSKTNKSLDLIYCKPTDWARARGAYYNIEERGQKMPYNSAFWTRSPYSKDPTRAFVTKGTLCDVTGAYTSARPAITINIS